MRLTRPPHARLSDAPRGVLLTLLVSLLVLSCGAPQFESGMGEFAPEPEPSAARQAQAPEESLDDARNEADEGAPPSDQPVSLPARPEPQQRLRVYSADLELVVAAVQDVRNRVITLAEEVGGYVESSDQSYVVIRVPAERFPESLEIIETLGTLRSRVVSTRDVTEQFTDLQRRIDLARATRQRLYRLLERTADNDERVRILREIRRLTEEIETLESRLESLDEDIRFSRIAVALISRIQEITDQRRTIPFAWIAWLDPLERTTGPAAQEITVDLPGSYAVFSEGKYVRGETPEGTQLRIGAVANEPSGDTSFWDDALRFHLGKLFFEDRRIAGGDFRGALFEAKSPDPFYYLVALSVRDDEIVVAEVFFPNREARDRRLDEVVRLLQEARL